MVNGDEVAPASLATTVNDDEPLRLLTLAATLPGAFFESEGRGFDSLRARCFVL